VFIVGPVKPVEWEHVEERPLKGRVIREHDLRGSNVLLKLLAETFHLLLQLGDFSAKFDDFFL